MSNLFSSFDPSISIFSLSFGLNWASSLLSLSILPSLFWLQKSQFSKTFDMVYANLRIELSSVLGKESVQSNSFLFSSVFSFIIFSNFMGLFPYIFTSSSHLSFTLTLALSSWLGSMLWAIFYQYNNILAHLVPLGTPGGLMPVMVVIETVSSMIRPFTLAVRLAANMVAGHLLLALLGSQNVSGSILGVIFLLSGISLLMFLEIAVACIQSYVFTILSSLYLKEISTITLNLK